MKPGKTRALAFASGLVVCALPLAGFADEAEDSSAAFQSDAARIGAERGVAAAEATVTTDENGMTSAVVGLSALRMLVVRQNEDGTLSYGHAATDDQVKEFVESDTDNKAAEE